MFGWFLVLVLVVVIFSADRLPELKVFLQNASKDGVSAVKKGAKTAQEKFEKVKAEKAKKAAEAKEKEEEKE